MTRNCLWKMSMMDLCPLCNLVVETRRHVYQCKDALAVAHQNQSILEFRKELEKAYTNPIPTNHIVRSIYQYVGGFHVSKLPTTGNCIKNLDGAVSLNELLDVGIDNMIAEVITTDATDIQQRYASIYNMGDRFSILSWNRTLIKALLDLSNS